MPLSQNIREVGERGTRHTAGLGISEHTDAFTIIVSEEHGTITLAEEGRLEIVEKEELRRRLDGFYQLISPPAAGSKRFSGITNNSLIKITSIGIALLLWTLFAFRTEAINRTFTVPVEYRNIPNNWIVETPSPSQVQVSFSGMERAFNFDPANLVISIDMSDPSEAAQNITVKSENINSPSGIKVNQISPKSLSIKAYQVTTVTLPIKVVTRGKLPKQLKLSEIKVHPEFVQVTTTPSRALELNEVWTEPIFLDTIFENTTLKVMLQKPIGAHAMTENQNGVKVSIILKPLHQDKNAVFR